MHEAPPLAVIAEQPVDPLQVKAEVRLGARRFERGRLGGLCALEPAVVAQ
ncbi:unannotated protein [freshwater metagenome]|uniref:Unannotated protein n=1 Tax=freshwater metagenome TaxID=449393 RepID=A0A6J7ABW6_9ZZZZ